MNGLFLFFLLGRLFLRRGLLGLGGRLGGSLGLFLELLLGRDRLFDLAQVLAKIEDDLWKEITCAKAEITHNNLPVVIADAGQMEQLLGNLLSNALKFSGGKPARVHVAAEELEDHWQIAVRDQGIGIDPRSQERIFVMFQRLHTQREYPGTGIGLAICRRIVERHGGTIRVESTPGRGSIFVFTIAKKSEEFERQRSTG